MTFDVAGTTLHRAAHPGPLPRQHLPARPGARHRLHRRHAVLRRAGRDRPVLQRPPDDPRVDPRPAADAARRHRRPHRARRRHHDRGRGRQHRLNRATAVQTYFRHPPAAPRETSMRLELPPLPTTVVGSLPQPDWLIDRDRLGHQFPPRVRAAELWRIPPESPGRGAGRRHPGHHPRAGGGRAGHPRPTARSAGSPTPTTSPRRWTASTSTTPARCATARAMRHPGAARHRRRSAGPARSRSTTCGSSARTPTGRSRSPCPGRSRWPSRRRTTTTPTTGPWRWPTPTSSGEEIADLFAAGADIVQLDEPWLQARPEVARRYGVEALNRALDGAAGPVHVHLCFGYAAMVADRPDGYSFLPELADTPAGHDLGGDRPVAPGPGDAAAAARQGHRTRRARPVDTRGRDAGARSPTGCAGRWTTSTSTSWCSPATAA